LSLCHYANAAYTGTAGDINHDCYIGEIKFPGSIHKEHSFRPHREQTLQALLQLKQGHWLRIDIHRVVFLNAEYQVLWVWRNGLVF
jgi:hypothetical protein